MNNKPIVVPLNSKPTEDKPTIPTTVKKPVNGADKVNLPIDIRGHKNFTTGFNKKR